MKNPIKTKPVAVMMLVLAAALLILAPTVVAQTITPGGIVHVGAEEIASVAVYEAGKGTAMDRGAVLDGVRDNTYAEACVRVEAGGTGHTISVADRWLPPKYLGGWNPDQEQYNPCPSGISSTDPAPPPPGPGDHYVVSTEPANGETGVSPNVVIKAKFSEPVKPNSVLNNFILKDAKGKRVRVSLVSYDEQSNTAFLEPVVPLEANTYNATIQKEVKDMDGRRMAADYTWSFTV